MKLNLENVSSGTSVLGAGIYQAKITEVSFDVIKESEVVKVKFADMDGAGSIQDTFWLSDKALWRLKRLAMSCGIANFGEFDPEELEGKLLTITVAETEYKGKTIMKVKDFSPVKVDPKIAGLRKAVKDVKSGSNDPF